MHPFDPDELGPSASKWRDLLAIAAVLAVPLIVAYTVLVIVLGAVFDVWLPYPD